MRAVTAVIVNFRTKELTAQAVQSCLLEPEVTEVVVVDNASGDDSVDWLRLEFEAQPVAVVASEENRGFGWANNVGVREAANELCLLLNSDAYLLPGAVERLVAALEQDSSVGVVAPLILNQDEQTEQASTYGAFPSVGSILLRARGAVDPISPDWVSGVAMLVRREEFLFLRGFDERFFMYFEDVELCHRYHRSGKRVLRETAARIVHLGGQSRSSSFNQKKQYYASQDLYLEAVGTPHPYRALIAALRWPAYWIRKALGRV